MLPGEKEHVEKVGSSSLEKSCELSLVNHKTLGTPPTVGVALFSPTTAMLSDCG